MISDKFAINLKNQRLNLGLTQEQLAKRVGGITKSNISQYESGLVKPKCGRIKLLADALYIDADTLMFGDVIRIYSNHSGEVHSPSGVFMFLPYSVLYLDEDGDIVIYVGGLGEVLFTQCGSMEIIMIKDNVQYRILTHSQEGEQFVFQDSNIGQILSADKLIDYEIPEEEITINGSVFKHEL